MPSVLCTRVFLCPSQVLTVSLAVCLSLYSPSQSVSLLRLSDSVCFHPSNGFSIFENITFLSWECDFEFERPIGNHDCQYRCSRNRGSLHLDPKYQPSRKSIVTPPPTRSRNRGSLRADGFSVTNRNGSLGKPSRKSIVTPLPTRSRKRGSLRAGGFSVTNRNGSLGSISRNRGSLTKQMDRLAESRFDLSTPSNMLRTT